MLPNRLDSESRRKKQIGGGKISGTSTPELDRMADEGVKFILFSLTQFERLRNIEGLGMHYQNVDGTGSDILGESSLSQMGKGFLEAKLIHLDK